MNHFRTIKIICFVTFFELGMACAQSMKYQIKEVTKITLTKSDIAKLIALDHVM